MSAKYTWSGPNGPGEGNLADWFRQLSDEGLLHQHKDAVKELKRAQGVLLSLDAEMARRLAEATA